MRKGCWDCGGVFDLDVDGEVVGGYGGKGEGRGKGHIVEITRLFCREARVRGRER